MTRLSNYLLALVALQITIASSVAMQIESWQFNESAGTSMTGLINDVGTSSFPFDRAHVTTNGSGALEFTQGIDSNDKIFSSIILSDPNQSSGVFELEWSYLSGSLNGGDLEGANVGFGMRDTAANEDLFLLRLHRQGGTLRVQTRINNTNTNWFDFGSSSLSGSDTPLNFRAVADLDNDLLDIFYSAGVNPETSIQDIAIPDLEFDAVRLVANTDTVNWGATDSVAVDYLNLSKIEETGAGIVLEVNTSTGFMTIKNELGSNVDMDFYEINSAGSLNPDGWNPLQEQSNAGFPPGDGTGNGWEVIGLDNPHGDFNLDGEVNSADYTVWRDNLGANETLIADLGNDNGVIDGADYTVWSQAFGDTLGPSNSLFAEAFLLGSSSLADDASIPLGNGFSIGGSEDLAFQIRLANGTIIPGEVRYVSDSVAVTVPEPSSGLLASLFLGLFSMRRSRNLAISKREIGFPYGFRLSHYLSFMFILLMASHSMAQPDRTRPNIVLVYADDMGIGDTSAYQDLGNNPDDYQIDTPNIERLANIGTRFTDVHSASALCSPSRVSLMTGRYSFRSDLKYSVTFDGQDINSTLMTQGGKTTKTVGNLLQDVGYKTYGVGKWHLGVETDSSSINTSRNLLEGPTHVGFDHFTGTLGNPDSTGRLIEDTQFVKFASTSPSDLTTTPLSGSDTPQTNWVINNDDGELQHSKLTQRHLDAAKSFMDSHANGGNYDDQPFFMYYSSHANHHPYYNAASIQTDANGTPASVPLTGNTVAGGPIRVTTIPDNDGDGIPEPSDSQYPGSLLTAADNLGEGWDRYYEEDNQGNQIDNSASRRADTVQENDIVLGELIDYLEATDDPRNIGGKLIDNTLIIFTSDNGANIGGPGVGGLEQESNNQSVNLRGRKSTQWEGGTRVPFVAAWAGEIQSGMTSDALFGQQDLYSTFAEITGQQLEQVYADAEGADSESVLDALQGTATGTVRESDLIYKRNADLIIRRGDIKLIATESDYNSSGDRVDPGGATSGLDWQDLVITNLFDLSTDLDESVNLINDPAWTAIRDDLFQALQTAIGPDAETGFTRGIIGDLNHDGVLNAADWLQFRLGFGDNLSSFSDLEAYKRGDLDGDFDADIHDFSMFKQAFDQVNGAGSFAALLNPVPEPSSAVLLMLAVLTVARFRRSN